MSNRNKNQPTFLFMSCCKVSSDCGTLRGNWVKKWQKLSAGTQTRAVRKSPVGVATHPNKIQTHTVTLAAPLPHVHERKDGRRLSVEDSPSPHATACAGRPIPQTTTRCRRRGVCPLKLTPPKVKPASLARPHWGFFFCAKLYHAPKFGDAWQHAHARSTSLASGSGKRKERWAESRIAVDAWWQSWVVVGCNFALRNPTVGKMAMHPTRWVMCSATPCACARVC